MKLGFLFVFIFWYGIMSLVFNMIPSEVQHGVVVDYDFNSDINASGFNGSEVDSGGFFSGALGIVASIGRFLGFIFFGVGLPAGTPTGFSVFLIFWNTAITLSFIAWFISAFWNG